MRSKRDSCRVGGGLIALDNLLGEVRMESEPGGYWEWVGTVKTSLWGRCIEVVDAVGVVVVVEVVEGEAWDLHRRNCTVRSRRGHQGGRL